MAKKKAATKAGTSRAKAAASKTRSSTTASGKSTGTRQPRKQTKVSAAKKTSGLDAAARVLAEAVKPLSTKEMIEAMAAKGYWKSPGGKTPDRTLYSAIAREIAAKGKESRFEKIEKGRFALRQSA